VSADCRASFACLLAFAGSVAWGQTSTYVNPVDGEEYTAEWQTHVPEAPQDHPGDRVATQRILLLTPEDDSLAEGDWLPGGAAMWRTHVVPKSR